MITLQNVHYEIRDEVRKNDKVHNSKTGSTLKCHSALEFSFLLLTHSYFSTAHSSMYIAHFINVQLVEDDIFHLQKSQEFRQSQTKYIQYSHVILQSGLISKMQIYIQLLNQPSLVIRVRPHDFYKLLLLMRVYKLQMIAN